MKRRPNSSNGIATKSRTSFSILFLNGRSKGLSALISASVPVGQWKNFVTIPEPLIWETKLQKMYLHAIVSRHIEQSFHWITLNIFLLGPNRHGQNQRVEISGLRKSVEEVDRRHARVGGGWKVGGEVFKFTDVPIFGQVMHVILVVYFP